MGKEWENTIDVLIDIFYLKIKYKPENIINYVLIPATCVPENTVTFIFTRCSCKY